MASSDVHRKLTAILSADVVGYSRLMGDDDVVTAGMAAPTEKFGLIALLCCVDIDAI